jgi:pimeloyl-ACP methyl ester carboxylesterase
LAEDVATTQRAIDLVKGKVILVGHSWGGMVITQAGNDPKVVGLVYLAAYGPDSGESLQAVSANAPQTELTNTSCHRAVTSLYLKRALRRYLQTT